MRTEEGRLGEQKWQKGMGQGDGWIVMWLQR